MSSHFELFGLAPAFAVDAAALDRAYREIQSRVHPDRFAHAGDAERRASMQWTTRVNEAYRTLKSPVQRAKYLLELNGVDVGFETNTQMPGDFLLRQLELRETLAGANQPEALDALLAEVRREQRLLVQGIAQLIDDSKDYAAAAGEVRKLMFLDKLAAEIDVAYEKVE
ncbi:MAG: Fe-S protein assembly co-chaperone HscB [Betaproteobacteria bacterium]|nr:Fe-S protein assembly co-chaperone HscB [Betaproteobacteria bacterium]MDH5352402.1 Fe-S protein assembly co-chaperone HscB [Betaproteobacteria bacterium]